MVSRDGFNVWIAVYMMASRRHGMLYIAVTSRFPARIAEHREGPVLVLRNSTASSVWSGTRHTKAFSRQSNARNR
jgi:predicted GIY-YIG superfamily endonuclease